MDERLIANRDAISTSSQCIVTLLGTFGICMSHGGKPRLRSRSVGLLLAFLSLQRGQDVSKVLLRETFWPDSDAHQQDQNLRRALSDIRTALGFGEGSNGIRNSRIAVALDAPNVKVDAQDFRDCVNKSLTTRDEESFEKAIQLYGGPLLAGVEDPWVYGYRLEYEELYCQVVAEYCQILTGSNRAREAIRIARSAIALAPLREDIRVALIRAYRSAGLEAEAIREYEELEQVLEEQWGIRPSAAAEAAFTDRPSVAQKPPVEVSDRYLRRAVDVQAEDCIDRGEVMLLLQGPRQSGKSSLLARLMHYAKTREYRVAHADLQTLGQADLSDGIRVYRSLGHTLARQLKVEVDPDALWRDWSGPNLNLDSIVHAILCQVQTPVLWVLDRADRLFAQSYTDDFFGLLRSWHNRRVLEPDGPWQWLHLVITYAEEPHLFLSDLNQSPFNIGVRLRVTDFTPDEVEKMANLYGLRQPKLAHRIFALTNGHPDFTRKALDSLTQGEPIDRLECSLFEPSGPFGETLQRTAEWLVSQPDLLVEVRNLLEGSPPADMRSMHRLASAGVTKWERVGKAVFRSPIHSAFFETRFP